MEGIGFEELLLRQRRGDISREDSFTVHPTPTHNHVLARNQTHSPIAARFRRRRRRVPGRGREEEGVEFHGELG